MNSEDMIRQLERIVHKYTRMEKGKKNIKAGISLSYAEIHTIDAIGSNVQINITTLAQLQGITKGAVSQMVNKLVEKGFVSKKISPDSDAMLILELTESGEKVRHAHAEYHRKQGVALAEHVKDFSQEYIEIFRKGMDLLEKFIDQSSEDNEIN